MTAPMVLRWRASRQDLMPRSVLDFRPLGVFFGPGQQQADDAVQIAPRPQLFGFLQSLAVFGRGRLLPEQKRAGPEEQAESAA